MGTATWSLMSVALLLAMSQGGPMERRQCEDASCLPGWASMLAIYVVDEAGAAIADAAVTGRFDGNIRTEIVTDRYGLASFSVPVGADGDVTLDAPGFKPVVLRHFAAREGTALTMVVPLQMDIEKLRGIVDYPSRR